MVPFSFTQAPDTKTAVAHAAAGGTAHVTSPTQFLGGGTTLIDLMKLDVMQPTKLIDIKRIGTGMNGEITVQNGVLRIGALATMAQIGNHPAIIKDYPVLSQTMLLAASQQLRNMARAGGNVLQRTRCSYFRDVQEPQCNKRNPGSGCAAMTGNNRWHAVLGTSDACIAAYPGDWAQALAALDADVEILGAQGQRTIKFNALHRDPGSRPDVETNLVPGELITGYVVQGGPWPRSHYVKVRDRSSYEFGLATAAVALKMQGNTVSDARIALGGVAYRPWRVPAAEAALRGKPLDEPAAETAAAIALQGAKTYSQNAFKVPLAKATLVRALLEAKDMTV